MYVNLNLKIGEAVEVQVARYVHIMYAGGLDNNKPFFCPMQILASGGLQIERKTIGTTVCKS